MSYSVLAVLGILAAVVIDLVLLRTRILLHRVFWASYAIVLMFQLVVNGVLTGFRIVRYNPKTIIGLRVVYAPVEDLLFGFAMVLMTLSVWMRLDRRRRPVVPAPPEPDPAPRR